MVLNSSTKSTEFSALEPVDTLKQIIECPTAAKSQSRFNQMLHLKKCKVSVPLVFMALLIPGDWILRNPKNAYMISILFLGKEYQCQAVQIIQQRATSNSLLTAVRKFTFKRKEN